VVGFLCYPAISCHILPCRHQERIKKIPPHGSTPFFRCSTALVAVLGEVVPDNLKVWHPKYRVSVILRSQWLHKRATSRVNVTIWLYMTICDLWWVLVLLICSDVLSVLITDSSAPGTVLTWVRGRGQVGSLVHWIGAQRRWSLRFPHRLGRWKMRKWRSWNPLEPVTAGDMFLKCGGYNFLISWY
jgi:hypothetical protein